MPNIKVKRGFTLIELLIVITIIGILATIAIASFSSAQGKARDGRRKGDLDALKKAFELAKSDSTGGFYPQQMNTASLETPGYIKKIPTDPQALSATYVYTPAPAACTTACTSYTLTACLENGNDNSKDAVKAGCASYAASYTISNP